MLAATNRPDMLDAALIRPGRIDRKVEVVFLNWAYSHSQYLPMQIYVPPPDEQSREQILRIELRKMPVERDVDLARLVALTAGFSGAEIVAVGSEAAMLAVEQDAPSLSQADLEAAARGIKPQITASMLEFYENYTAKL